MEDWESVLSIYLPERYEKITIKHFQKVVSNYHSIFTLTSVLSHSELMIVEDHSEFRILIQVFFPSSGSVKKGRGNCNGDRVLVSDRNRIHCILTNRIRVYCFFKWSAGSGFLGMSRVFYFFGGWIRNSSGSVLDLISSWELDPGCLVGSK